MKVTVFFVMMLFLMSIVTAQCTDTDGGKNKYESGSVTDPQGAYEDECLEENIKEYFCSVEGIAAYTTLQCVNGCQEGACQLANNEPIAQAPETESDSNLKWYFYGIIVLITAGIYIYLFKWKKKKRY